jgi:hypothetical protein
MSFDLPHVIYYQDTNTDVKHRLSVGFALFLEYKVIPMEVSDDDDLGQ